MDPFHLVKLEWDIALVSAGIEHEQLHGAYFPDGVKPQQVFFQVFLYSAEPL